MFDVFEKGGVMNSEIGKRYRTCILEPGGSKDGEEMIRNFLQREPDQKNFLKSIGLEV